MTDVYLNGRQATAWEAAAIGAAREHEHERDCETPAGLLADAPQVVPQGLDLPAIHAEIPKRRTDNLSVPVLS